MEGQLDGNDMSEEMALENDPVSGPSALTAREVDAFVKRLNELEFESGSLEGVVSPKASTAAVIVAGGVGERFGNPGGKQLYKILGRPVLTWSVEAFDATPDVGQIIIVCDSARRDEYRARVIDPYEFKTPIEFADAGEIRQESAMNGVDAVSDKFEYVAVHDGARPLVTVELITHAINSLKGDLEADGIVVGHPSIDTLKVVNERSIVGTPDRNMFWIAQTPQVFRTHVVRRAYKTAMYDGFVGTDDSSLVERIGGKVLMLNGPRDNIKVTVPEDVGPVIAALAARVAHREA